MHENPAVTSTGPSQPLGIVHSCWCMVHHAFFADMCCTSQKTHCSPCTFFRNSSGLKASSGDFASWTIYFCLPAPSFRLQLPEQHSSSGKCQSQSVSIFARSFPRSKMSLHSVFLPKRDLLPPKRETAWSA